MLLQSTPNSPGLCFSLPQSISEFLLDVSLLLQILVTASKLVGLFPHLGKEP